MSDDRGEGGANRTYPTVTGIYWSHAWGDDGSGGDGLHWRAYANRKPGSDWAEEDPDDSDVVGEVYLGHDGSVTSDIWFGTKGGKGHAQNQADHYGLHEQLRAMKRSVAHITDNVYIYGRDFRYDD